MHTGNIILIWVYDLNELLQSVMFGQWVIVGIITITPSVNNVYNIDW